ncbi:MAG: hypothetical protein R3F61_30065 [Myxococcota bacterium]
MARRPQRVEPAWKHRVDRVVAGILVPVLALAVGALLWRWLAEGAAVFTGDGEPDLLWLRAAETVGWSPEAVRIAVFGPVQAVWLAALWVPLRRVRDVLTTTLDRVPAGRVGSAVGAAGTLLALGIGAPFVLQPTLVPLSMSVDAWLQRTANLLDGTASEAAAGSVANAWRRVNGQAVPGRFTVARAESGLEGAMMTRWDPILRKATRSREHYAQTRAFLYVESGGRQFAVSETGCAGLMQFCVGTAQRSPFAGIFGLGGVSACDCGGRPCRVPRAVADALETDGDALVRHAGAFPCNPADARFDPERAIRAGAAFTTELAELAGGNLEIMYIGYNSGPAVARRLVAITGPRADLAALRPHLAGVLARWYGDRARGRAQGLLDVHLPKLRKAYEASLRTP